MFDTRKLVPLTRSQGTSIAGLCRRLGVPRSTFYLWMTKGSAPEDLQQRIERALGVPRGALSFEEAGQ